ncbi:hypothetical protein [Paenibacillus phocaensis]|uniref:hypothetical protein n=1 Tax=Paenibacillus phocaensis TaxID=1776378 RepID=UPI000839D5C9|nr:hypothetical protein [Paenibacillus phocaensis]
MSEKSQVIPLLEALQALKPGSLATQADVDRFKKIVTDFVEHQNRILTNLSRRLEVVEGDMEDIYADDIAKMAGLMFIEHKGLEEEFLDFLEAKTIEISRDGLVQ